MMMTVMWDARRARGVSYQLPSPSSHPPCPVRLPRLLPPLLPLPRILLLPPLLPRCLRIPLPYTMHTRQFRDSLTCMRDASGHPVLNEWMQRKSGSRRSRRRRDSIPCSRGAMRQRVGCRLTMERTYSSASLSSGNSCSSSSSAGSAFLLLPLVAMIVVVQFIQLMGDGVSCS